MIWVSPLWFTEVRERIRKKSSEPLSHTSFKSKSKAREGNHWLDFGSNLSQSISHAGFCHLRSSGSFLLCIESGLSRLSTTSKCVLSVLCCTTKYNKVSLSKSLSKGNTITSLFAFIQTVAPFLWFVICSISNSVVCHQYTHSSYYFRYEKSHKSNWIWMIAMKGIGPPPSLQVQWDA